MEYEFTVPKDSSEELRVTLVWTDRPGCLSFDKVLINDLDLILELPDGKTLRGDELNKNDKVDDNVEQIIIKPKNGKYKVTVYGASVPAGKQGFALVVSEPVEG